MTNSPIRLIKTTADHLEAHFVIQLDPEANRLAAFTSNDPTDKQAFMQKWEKILNNRDINNQTILFNGEIAGSIAKYIMEGDAEITYWIDRHLWGKGIASKALELFLEMETTRPIFGRVAFDNHGSQRILEKGGFKRIGSDVGFAEARQAEIEEYIYKLS